MPFLGVPELVIIVFVVIFMFGAQKIPELARSLATGITEFRRGIQARDDGGNPE